MERSRRESRRPNAPRHRGSQSAARSHLWGLLCRQQSDSPSPGMIVLVSVEWQRGGGCAASPATSSTERVSRRALASLEESADQDLLRRADIGEGAVDPNVVVGDAEEAHVVGRHRSRAAPECDRANRLEVEGHPEDATVGEVDVLDLDGQEAEAAAAAELRL